MSCSTKCPPSPLCIYYEDDHQDFHIDGVDQYVTHTWKRNGLSIFAILKMIFETSDRNTRNELLKQIRKTVINYPANNQKFGEGDAANSHGIMVSVINDEIEQLIAAEAQLRLTFSDDVFAMLLLVFQAELFWFYTKQVSCLMTPEYHQLARENSADPTNQELASRYRACHDQFMEQNKVIKEANDVYERALISFHHMMHGIINPDN